MTNREYTATAGRFMGAGLIIGNWGNPNWLFGAGIVLFTLGSILGHMESR